MIQTYIPFNLFDKVALFGENVFLSMTWDIKSSYVPVTLCWISMALIILDCSLE